jgi:hypothetical protein
VMFIGRKSSPKEAYCYGKSHKHYKLWRRKKMPDSDITCSRKRQ